MSGAATITIAATITTRRNETHKALRAAGGALRAADPGAIELSSAAARREVHCRRISNTRTTVFVSR